MRRTTKPPPPASSPPSERSAAPRPRPAATRISPPLTVATQSATRRSPVRTSTARSVADARPTFSTTRTRGAPEVKPGATERSASLRDTSPASHRARDPRGSAPAPRQVQIPTPEPTVASLGFTTPQPTPSPSRAPTPVSRASSVLSEGSYRVNSSIPRSATPPKFLVTPTRDTTEHAADTLRGPQTEDMWSPHELPPSPTPAGARPASPIALTAQPARRRRSAIDDSPIEDDPKRLCVSVVPSPPTPTQGAMYAAAAASQPTATAATSQPSAAANLTTQPQPIPRPRFPPFVVENMPNWAQHFRTLKERLGHIPSARPYGKGIRFIPNTEQEFRIVQKYLTEIEKSENVHWFSYSLPSERSLKIAIRGLPADTDPEDISRELESKGFTPEYVRPIKARSGRPGCIFLAILRRTEGLTPAIYETSDLLNMSGIKIEAWIGRKGPAQCHKCQAFRHSSHNCHRTQACVRCGENHRAKDCPRPKEEPATCINCGGPHPANNSGCPVFKKEARNRKAGSLARTMEAASRSAPQPSTSSHPPKPQSLPQQDDRAPQGSVVATNATTISLMAPARNPTIQIKTAKTKKKKRRQRTKKQPPSDAAPDQTEAPLQPIPAAPVLHTPAASQQPTSMPQRTRPERASTGPSTASFSLTLENILSWADTIIKKIYPIIIETIAAYQTGHNLQAAILRGLATITANWN